MEPDRVLGVSEQIIVWSKTTFSRKKKTVTAALVDAS